MYIRTFRLPNVRVCAYVHAGIKSTLVPPSSRSVLSAGTLGIISHLMGTYTSAAVVVADVLLRRLGLPFVLVACKIHQLELVQSSVRCSLLLRGL